MITSEELQAILERDDYEWLCDQDLQVVRDRRALLGEIDRLQALIRSQAERIAEQAELLARRAERDQALAGLGGRVPADSREI
jgi:hypothetical protein